MSAPSEAAAPAAGPPVVLDISGMTCASCVARVERALAKVDVVADASVNLATESVRVTVAGRIDAQALKVADRAYGIQGGRVVLSFTGRELTNNEDVRRAIRRQEWVSCAILYRLGK